MTEPHALSSLRIAYALTGGMGWGRSDAPELAYVTGAKSPGRTLEPRFQKNGPDGDRWSL